MHLPSFVSRVSAQPYAVPWVVARNLGCVTLNPTLYLPMTDDIMISGPTEKDGLVALVTHMKAQGWEVNPAKNTGTSPIGVFPICSMV